MSGIYKNKGVYFGEEFKHMSITFPAFKNKGVPWMRIPTKMSVTFPGFKKGTLPGAPLPQPKKKVSRIRTWNGELQMARIDPD